MKRRITITSGDVRAEAELNASATATAILEALPIQATANTWGKEVYFDIGVTCPQADDAKEDMTVGELGYWPVGKAFCIFFGPTPVSGRDGRPRAAGPVNPIGRVIGDATIFAAVGDGERIALAAKP